MLARYQPVTVVDTHESFVPTSVEAFVADATLETQDGAEHVGGRGCDPVGHRAPDIADDGVRRAGARSVLPAEPAALHSGDGCCVSVVLRHECA